VRLLIECTFVYEHPDMNTGIQRVVRNIVSGLGDTRLPVQCIPVMLQRDQIHHVLSLAPLPAEARRSTIRGKGQWLLEQLDWLRKLSWRLHGAIERRWPFRAAMPLRRVLHFSFRAGNFFVVSLPTRILRRLVNRNGKPPPQRAVPLQIKAGDQLLWLDSSWHDDKLFPLVNRLKAQGVGIIPVIYDFIPLTHPQFCDAGLTLLLDRWLEWIAEIADGFVAISQTVSQQVEDELKRRIGAEAAARRWYRHFYLGSELDLRDHHSDAEPELKQLFDAPWPVYLMVGTIEPRKNHAYLLDAFERLWSDGSEARLCIIGMIGWKCSDLLERIRYHPQWGKRLFMFNQASDRSLEYAYAHARALVFPSHIEGFGLPLVEAMQRHLPVMASDIPVFREIGGDFVAYFDLANPDSLATMIERFEQSGEFPATRTLSEWHWIGWPEACKQLVDSVLDGLGSKPSTRAGLKPASTVPLAVAE
jgi:alpha-1,2-rhamnosyltransferase